MEEHLILVTAEAAAPARTEQLEGRDHLVFPAVLVRSQVLTNNLGSVYLPPEEIEASVDAWNGVPVVIRHPEVRGVSVSARDPRVLNARGVGRVFHAHYQDGALRGDVFLDPARVEGVDDAADMVANVQRGDPGEVSTGFRTRLDNTPGEVDGARYTAILRDLSPDHLALLPDQVGACSVLHGCGLARNHAGPCVTTTNADPAPASDADPGFIRAMFQRFAAMLGLGPAAANESDNDRREALRDALSREFGGLNRYVWVEDVLSEQSEVVFEISGGGPESGLYAASYEIAEDGTVTLGAAQPRRRKTTYEPVVNAAGPTTARDGMNMNREETITQLAEAGPLDRTALEALSDCQLQALAGASSEPSNEPTAEPAPASNANPGVGAEALAALTKAVAGLTERVTVLQGQVAPAVVQQEAERAQLIVELAANALVPFDADELGGRTLEELRKLRAMSRRENYALMGAPRGAPAPGSGPQFMPIRPYWDAPSTPALEN